MTNGINALKMKGLKVKSNPIKPLGSAINEHEEGC